MALSYDKKDNIEVVVVDQVPDFEYEIVLKTESDKTRLAKMVEKAVRSSMEYSDYIQFLRANVGMDACAFFSNVNKSTNRKIKIEIHHAPLTLYDIADIVIDKTIDTGGEINALLIAEEVMELHYHNQVGLIPLSKTLHEVVHSPSGEKMLTIPMYMIYGDFKAFLKEYEPYIEKNERVKKKIQDMIIRTKELNENSFDSLKEKFTYLKVDGFEMPMKMEESEEAKELVDKLNVA